VNSPTREEVEALRNKLHEEAEAGGYHLNPDADFTRDLVTGLIVNERRYGYPVCPCRLASGVKAEDLDIICPCDYRDPDLADYGMCYCALYVSQDVLDGRRPVKSIPDRRPPASERLSNRALAASRGAGPAQAQALKYPVWRCTVCGYLGAREQPPEVCPVCKAAKERFERFM
jgi:ferredoxin-thioredoxin reductase catalytic chain